MHIFHKWSKWEKYETISLSSFYCIPCKQRKIMQRRECITCGFTQDEWISNIEFVSLTKEDLTFRIAELEEALTFRIAELEEDLTFRIAELEEDLKYMQENSKESSK
jgi:hypothetical protein